LSSSMTYTRGSSDTAKILASLNILLKYSSSNFFLLRIYFSFSF
jgi:hypothetical protein